MACVPVRLRLLIVTGPESTAPVWVSVIVLAVDTVLITTLPKLKLVAEVPSVPGTVVGVSVAVGVWVGVFVGV